jgi:hypothetical protein
VPGLVSEHSCILVGLAAHTLSLVVIATIPTVRL